MFNSGEVIEGRLVKHYLVVVELDREDESKVAMKSVENVVFQSRYWLHGGDLFQEVEKCVEVESPFVFLRSLEEDLSKTLRSKRSEEGMVMEDEDDEWFKYLRPCENIERHGI
ncbi:hypothetical protein Tco_0269167 [Tanacetum coccineum]